MTDVAEEAGVSLGALYRYFVNREDLFTAMLGDLHEELYDASRARGVDFAADPLLALMVSNRGYIEHYYANRDVMRAFIEAATVEERFRKIWWDMRRRHVDRVLAALNAQGHELADTRWAALAAEAAAAATEQVMYIWFAQESMGDRQVTVEEATTLVTSIWYGLLYGDAQALDFAGVPSLEDGDVEGRGPDRLGRRASGAGRGI